MDGRRLVGEVEGAGDDVAVGADDQAAGRADALADTAPRPPAGDQLGAAGRLDLHDARRDLLDGRLDRLLLQVVQVVVRPRRAGSRQYGHSQRREPAGIRRIACIMIVDSSPQPAVRERADLPPSLATAG